MTQQAQASAAPNTFREAAWMADERPLNLVQLIAEFDDYLEF
ncbi:hypothetical protein [Lactiplantibacillus paraplantarum]|nr:hypothetical protein [Lactiplantibacillus paraplantarum]WEE35379.1 hypothetical protein PWO93_11860 [Lactiplantibacillus paraplantarum]